MKNKFIKKIAMTVSIILMIPTGFVCNTTKANAQVKKSSNQIFSSEQEVTSAEETTVSGETSTEETTGIPEETTETPTEETTTEGPTEPPTTVDYRIIDGVYKVKNGKLIEYLGDESDKSVTSLTIPAEIKIIDKQIFKNCKYIEKIKFEKKSKITEIGDYAFNGCVELKSITLPSGLKKLGYRVFKKCTSLVEITLPDTITAGEQIFGIDGAIKKVTFESGFKTIPAEILRNAYTLETVNLGKKVTSIGKRAFYSCKSLKKISLPATVKTIGRSAFYNCQSLTKVTMSKNTITIGKYAFKKCVKLTSLTLYKKITSIASGAFAEDKLLILKVYANSYGKSYARKNKLKWQFTASEIRRQTENKDRYNSFVKLIKNKDKNKYKLKYLKNYVPQGTCIIDKYLIVSMYYRGLRKNSILLVYNKNSGKFVKKIALPFRDHVGAVTNVKGRLVVSLNNISLTDYVAVISSSRLKKAKPGKTIKYNYMVKIPGRADFAAFDGTYFWAGHSANISAPRMYGYKVAVKKKKLVFTWKHSFTVPPNSQGLVVKKLSKSRRKFVFSQSYGLISNSSMITYRVNINKAMTLGKAKSIKIYPSMIEGIIHNKGYMYILYESAAGLYCDNPDKKTEIRIKNVWKIKAKKLGY